MAPSSNVKWPFSLSHNRVQDGGWARQQNGRFVLFSTTTSNNTFLVHSMPIATTMAGVNMRLKAGGIRYVRPLQPEVVSLIFWAVSFTGISPQRYCTSYELAAMSSADVSYSEVGVRACSK